MFEKWNLAFDKLKQAVSKTSQSLVGDVVSLASSNDEFDEFTLDDIEEALIKADLGVDCAAELVDKIRKNKVKPSEIKDFLKNEFQAILSFSGSCRLNFDPEKSNIYFVVGVNGSGKTTTIAKLANRFKLEGKKVLVVAADTFRAAAEEQLDIWAKRIGVDILRRDKAEPASLVYEAIEKGGEYDVLIVDTAGRLQNKFNLMEELKKIKSVVDKKAIGANIETLLVLDANTGQNGLSQAKIFAQTVDLTGAVITKLDGSPKGGVIFTVAKEYGILPKLIGVGEKLEDLRDFNAEDFVKALF